MSTIQTKRCPSCGHVYERNTYAGHPSKDNRIKYGSPIRICPKCGKPIIDDEYREIAIDGLRKVDYSKISPATLFYGGFTIFIGILFLTVDTNVIIGILVTGVGIYLIVSEYLGYGKRQERFEQLRRESEQRLQNPQYAAALKNLGYHVPSRYLVDIQTQEPAESTAVGQQASAGTADGQEGSWQDKTGYTDDIGEGPHGF